MTAIATSPLLQSADAGFATPHSVLDTHQVACVSSARPVQRIVVITSRPASHTVVSAVQDMLTSGQTVRWIEHGQHNGPDVEAFGPALDGMTSWWEWADVVITEARDESIADCVERGFVPVVAMPKRHRDPLGARRALKTVHPWSSRGLALQLCLTKPAPGVLQAAVGIRAQHCANAPQFSHHAA